MNRAPAPAGAHWFFVVGSGLSTCPR